MQNNTQPTANRMQTRSMNQTLQKRQKKTHDECAIFDSNEEYNYRHNRAEYEKEQERRRIAGIKPVIICMGGPYSDAWYPHHN